MKCPKCDYSLWNITPGPCPECGRPFQPSNFDFKPGAVAFLCNGCEQPYYGSSRLGHLEPKTFECVACHRALDMDEMVIRPAEGFVGSHMLKQVTPWKSTHGNPFKRWFLMTGASLGSPVRFSEGLPSDRGLRIGLVFLSINLIIFPGLLITPIFILLAIGMAGFQQNLIEFLLPFTLWVLGVAGSMMILALFSGALSHLLLFKGKHETGLAKTLAALMVTSSPMCVLVVPCFGLYLTPAVIIWWLISFALSVRALHGVSTPHAFLAAFAPLLLLLFGLGSFLLLYA